MTTDSKHNLPVAPNLLHRNFAVAASNRAWVSDITYISTDEGWLYLAGLKDLFNGERLGYAMSERMTKNLVMQALFRGVCQTSAKGLILHSDRSSQYCAHDYQKLLRQVGMTAIQEITEYIEIFYNRQRTQARLGYLLPASFTQRYYAKQLAA